MPPAKAVRGASGTPALTGHEGYVPVAFVFAGRTKARRASGMRRLEEAARRYLAGESYTGQEPGITAVDYCQAVPVVVTELERIPADPDGAVGKVWRGPGAMRMSAGRWERPGTTPTASACTRATEGGPPGSKGV
ncbi:hypothetical protein [Streptomyces griseolus]|uniref:hypothetical protein n=1 Tax=Streptomyces griseolus TaxID=1909 RepID=UPI00224328EC|nr:hypothetical protein [Streptomyces griseolus]MCW8220423.1 hypothetical protein [Streptomyces griseolus]